MIVQFLCSLLMFLILASGLAAAEEKPLTLEDVIKTLPPELLYNGKPIEPGCVYGAEHNRGKYALQDLKTCKTEAIRSDFGFRRVDKLSPFGVTWCEKEGPEEGICSSYSYKYLGKTKDGLILQTYFYGGGSGHFTGLGIFQREGDVFREAKNILSGDRCIRGLVKAEVASSTLQYSYQATWANLYDAFRSSASPEQLKGLYSTPIDCVAIIHVKGSAVEKVELTANEKDPHYSGWLWDTYRDLVHAKGKILSADDAGAFVAKIEKLYASAVEEEKANEQKKHDDFVNTYQPKDYLESLKQQKAK